MPDNAVSIARPPTMALGSLSDPAELGRMLAASRYFADVQEAAQAVVKVLAGAELGIPPIASMTGVFIVKGRVTLGANLIAALVKRHPAYDWQIADLTNDRAAIVFLDTRQQCAVCAGRQLKEPGKICGECVGTGRLRIGLSEFTMDDARAAGIATGENWKHYPRNMLFARAVSNGAKWFVPDVFAGAPVYTPDELGAEIDGETGQPLLEVGGRMIDRQTGEVVEPVAPPVAPETPPEPPEPPSEPATPPPGPRPAVSAPDAADADAGADSAANGDEQIDNAEFAKLIELLDQVQAPESFRRMAAMAAGVDDLAQLTRAQALDVATTARARFGS